MAVVEEDLEDAVDLLEELKVLEGDWASVDSDAWGLVIHMLA